MNENNHKKLIKFANYMSKWAYMNKMTFKEQIIDE